MYGPMYGGQSPMYGGQPPMYGQNQPSYGGAYGQSPVIVIHQE